MMRRLLLAALFLSWTSASTEAAFGTLVPAAQYFVNQTTGSDSNNGTSAATPFLTIGKLVSVLQCGQLGAVYGGLGTQLKYREQFTGIDCSAGSTRQSLVGYGSFAPLFDASEVISAGAFSKTGGRTSVYQADVTFSAGGFARVWEDNLSLPRVADLATLDSTAASYYIAADPSGGSPSTLTLYVHATGNGNPASNSKVYEFNKRSYGVTSPSGMLVSNVQTRRQLGNNGSLEVGPNSFITSVTAIDGTKHNLLIHLGTTIRYCTLTDSYYNAQSKIALVLNDNTPTFDNATIEHCTYTESLELTGASGFYAHTNLGGSYGTVTCNDCNTGAGILGGISGFAAATTVITGGTFTSGGITLYSPTNTLRNLTALNVGTGGTAEAVELDHVTLTGPAAGGALYIGIGSHPSINLHDSTISNASAAGVYFGDTVTSFTMRNNLFTANTAEFVQGTGTDTLSLASSIDGNTYHYPTPAGARIFFHGTGYVLSQLADWNAWKALGFDATGSRVTP